MESIELHNYLMAKEPQTIPISKFIESGITFFIPSYQRGYRWGSNEILRLIKDIENFDPLLDGEFYCLQPVVVRFDEGTTHWRLIDGQQRLTTLFLILSTWEKPPFIIEYERDEAKSPIEQHYHSKAISTIKKWGNDNADKTSIICNILKEKCRIIWYRLPNYESEDTSLIKEHDFFLHLNSGKIALTDAELVKAYLLHKQRKSSEVYETFEQQQTRRASKWDLMERRLREEDFWRFIAGRRSIPSSALDYLLEILYYKYEQPEIEYGTTQNPIFSWIESANSKLCDPDVLWNELWTLFHRLEGWYNDPVIYNLIGVLSTRKSLNNFESKRIVAALKEWDKKDMTKSNFIAWLWGEVKAGLISEEDIAKAKSLNNLSFCDYEHLLEAGSSDQLPSYHKYNYTNTRKKVFDTLLLLNIALINPTVTGRKFPFKEFNNDKNIWNIEHISPNNPRNNQQLLEAIRAMRKNTQSTDKRDGTESTLANAVLWENLPQKIRDDFNSVISILERIDTSDGNEAREFPVDLDESQRRDKTFVDNFKEDYLPISDKEVMTLGNLTLLTERPNKGIGNNFFFNKRAQLSKYQAEGCFIPPLTLNVFTKWYTNDYDQPLFWRKQNRLEYLRALDNLVAGLTV